MRLLLLTDIHGNIEQLKRIVESEDFDAVLCAGDLSDANEFGDEYEESLDRVLEELDIEGVIAKAVPGNMDPENACVSKLIQRRMNIHKKIAGLNSCEVVGFGGGKTPFGTPFEPEGDEIKNAISTLYGRMNSDNRIAVIHQPPVDSNLDLVDGDHVGSPEVRELIEQTDFDMVLTGHIHESAGKDSINGTAVINPGPVLEGKYGIAEITESGLEVQMNSL